MSVSIYVGIYPKKCIDKEILPYLSISDESTNLYYGGNRFSEDMWIALKENGIHDEDNCCYIFEDSSKLQPLITKCPISVASELADGISIMDDTGMAMIFWIR